MRRYETVGMVILCLALGVLYAVGQWWSWRLVGHDVDWTALWWRFSLVTNLLVWVFNVGLQRRR